MNEDLSFQDALLTADEERELAARWSAVAPSSDFAGRVLDVWASERAALAPHTPPETPVPSQRRWVLQGLALAATLAVGVGIGTRLHMKEEVVSSVDQTTAQTPPHDPANGSSGPAPGSAAPSARASSSPTVLPSARASSVAITPRVELVAEAAASAPEVAAPQTRSAATIGPVVRALAVQAKSKCWEPIASTSKPERAQLTLQLTISPEGLVRLVLASGATEVPGLATCVKGVFAGGRFDPSREQTVVSVPVVFVR
jgi:hypothetical protein